MPRTFTASNHATRPMVQQGSIEKELSQAGVPQAHEVAGRLGEDFAREFPGPAAGKGYSTREDDVPSAAQTRSSRAEPRDDRGVYTEQRLQAKLDARIVAILNQSLSDCMHLRIQCQQARWDMIASETHQLSDLFKEIDQVIGEHVNGMAQRIQVLGGKPDGALATIAERSGLSDYRASAAHWHTGAASAASALMIISEALDDDIKLLLDLGDAYSGTLLDAIGRTLDKYLGRLPVPRLEGWDAHALSGR